MRAVVLVISIFAQSNMPVTLSYDFSKILGNMRVLRRTISEQQPPLIPHIGSCLTLLVYHEDQPLMDPRGHMINFSRFHGTAGLVEVSDTVWLRIRNEPFIHAHALS